jgi:molybdopterin molybdotransferase
MPDPEQATSMIVSHVLTLQPAAVPAHEAVGCLLPEDVACGASTVAGGTWLRPQEVGLLVDAGHEKVAVVPRPRACVLDTAGQPENAALVAAAVRSMGCHVEGMGVCEPESDAIEAWANEAGAWDVLLVLDGPEPHGGRDLALALQQGGTRVLFHEVDMSPAPGGGFGIFSRRPVLMLPGNPMPSLLACLLFVEPTLQKLGGHGNVEGPRLCFAMASRVLKNTRDQTAYIPAVLEMGEAFAARPLDSIEAPDLATCCDINAFIVLEPKAEVEAGGPVSVLMAE